VSTEEARALARPAMTYAREQLRRPGPVAPPHESQAGTAMRPASAECAWPGCGQPARVEVLVSVAGEPPGLAVWVGGYCAGHAVIIGIDTQEQHGGSCGTRHPECRALRSSQVELSSASPWSASKLATAHELQDSSLTKSLDPA